MRAAIAAVYILTLLFLMIHLPTKAYAASDLESKPAADSISFSALKPAANRSFAASSVEFVILSAYSKKLKIGEEYYLLAITSNGKKPTFSSSDSKVASVNSYGKITAKKSGTTKIRAKIRNGEAACTIKVEPTRIRLSASHITLENGCSARLFASASTGHEVAFRSNKKSIAVVDKNGWITAKKPGSAIITATADKTAVSCTVTVRKPSVSLSRKSVSLYRTKKIRLSVKSTSKSAPKWKSNKKSVAVVDACGTVTAIKNGSATITVTVDGISKSCQVTVKKPIVRFEQNEISMAAGTKRTVKAFVSSGNLPVYSSSNTCIADVDENGVITAVESGKAYIYAREDGVKSRIRIIVT